MKNDTNNPFVISCAYCKEILADSNTLRHYGRDYLIFGNSTLKLWDNESTASKIENFKNLGNKEAEKIKKDFSNNIYEFLICDCKNCVGLQLISASSKWNGFSGTFLFLKSEISFYSFNSEEPGAVTIQNLN